MSTPKAVWSMRVPDLRPMGGCGLPHESWNRPCAKRCWDGLEFFEYEYAQAYQVALKGLLSLGCGSEAQLNAHSDVCHLGGHGTIRGRAEPCSAPQGCCDPQRARA